MAARQIPIGEAFRLYLALRDGPQTRGTRTLLERMAKQRPNLPIMYEKHLEEMKQRQEEEEEVEEEVEEKEEVEEPGAEEDVEEPEEKQEDVEEEVEEKEDVEEPGAEEPEEKQEEAEVVAQCPICDGYNVFGVADSGVVSCCSCGANLCAKCRGQSHPGSVCEKSRRNAGSLKKPRKPPRRSIVSYRSKLKKVHCITGIPLIMQMCSMAG